MTFVILALVSDGKQMASDICSEFGDTHYYLRICYLLFYIFQFGYSSYCNIFRLTIILNLVMLLACFCFLLLTTHVLVMSILFVSNSRFTNFGLLTGLVRSWSCLNSFQISSNRLKGCLASY